MAVEVGGRGGATTGLLVKVEVAAGEDATGDEGSPILLDRCVDDVPGELEGTGCAEEIPIELEGVVELGAIPEVGELAVDVPVDVAGPGVTLLAMLEEAPVALLEPLSVLLDADDDIEGTVDEGAGGRTEDVGDDVGEEEGSPSVLLVEHRLQLRDETLVEKVSVVLELVLLDTGDDVVGAAEELPLLLADTDVDPVDEATLLLADEDVEMEEDPVLLLAEEVDTPVGELTLLLTDEDDAVVELLGDVTTR